MDDEYLFGVEPSGDPGHSDATRRFFWGPDSDYGTEDAARMGLDRNTAEGAQLAFFSHLDGRKPLHRAVAWAALILLFGVPVMMNLVNALKL